MNLDRAPAIALAEEHAEEAVKPYLAQIRQDVDSAMPGAPLAQRTQVALQIAVRFLVADALQRFKPLVIATAEEDTVERQLFAIIQGLGLGVGGAIGGLPPVIAASALNGFSDALGAGVRTAAGAYADMSNPQ